VAEEPLLPGPVEGLLVLSVPEPPAPVELGLPERSSVLLELELLFLCFLVVLFEVSLEPEPP